jgi:hypothetical protein
MQRFIGDSRVLSTEKVNDEFIRVKLRREGCSPRWCRMTLEDYRKSVATRKSQKTYPQ